MISVIVPAFNAKSTIGECVKAVLKQKTQEEFELIIVDDGSTDKTFEMAKKFRKAKIYVKKHSGPAAARNSGARKAKGEIILFTDSDCIPAENWIEEMAKPFKEKKVVAAQGAYKTKQKSLVARFVQQEIEDRYNKMKKSEEIDWVGTYSAAYRKKTFFEVKGFDEGFPIASGEDIDLSFKLSKKGRIEFNPKAIVYHKHPSSLLNYFKTKFFRGYWRVPLYQKHPKKIVRDSFTPQILKFQIIIFYLIVISLIASIFYAGFVAAALILLILLFASTLPFTAKAIRKDFYAGLFSPAIIFFRTAAFASGLLAGALKR